MGTYSLPFMALSRGGLVKNGTDGKSTGGESPGWTRRGSYGGFSRELLVSGYVCSAETIHGLILPEEPGSGSAIKIGSRLIRIGF
jgi:hypothetical protein